jgi:hypothetical protein
MASVVDGDMEVSKFLLRKKFMPKEVISILGTLLPCVLPLAPLTEVKVNAMKWIRGIAFGTRKKVNAVSALSFQKVL